MREKPTFPVFLWPVLEGLNILAYASKPSPYRKLYVVPIVSIIIYSVVFTQMGDLTYVLQTDWGMGCRFGTILLDSSINILLTDVQRELRLIGQKKNISEEPFLSRLWWGIILWGYPRGVNFAHEPKGYIPARPTHKTRRAFVVSQLGKIAFLLLVYDLNGIMNRANPYYAKDELTVTGFHRLWRLASIGYGVLTFLFLSIELKILSIIAVTLRISSPQDWPDLFGSFLDAYTIKRLWGKTWHQLFRRVLLVHSTFFAKKLRLSPDGAISYLFKLFFPFFLTGLLHYGGDALFLRSLTKSGAIPFFLLQAVGILLEGTFFSIVQKLGVRTEPIWFTKIIGYIWVIIWIGITLPIWTYPLYRAGFTVTIPHFSIILGLWRGEWVPVAK